MSGSVVDIELTDKSICKFYMNSNENDILIKYALQSDLVQLKLYIKRLTYIFGLFVILIVIALILSIMAINKANNDNNNNSSINSSNLNGSGASNIITSDNLIEAIKQYIQLNNNNTMINGNNNILDKSITNNKLSDNSINNNNIIDNSISL